MTTTTLNERQRAVLLDRLYRRLSVLDDESLVEFDTLTNEEYIYEDEPVEKAKNGPVSRRRFLLTMLFGSAAAVAAGSAAGLLLSEQSSPLIIEGLPQVFAPAPAVSGQTAPEVVIPTAGLPPETLAQIEELQRQLAQANADRLAIQAQLDAARGEIGTLAAERDTLSVNSDVLSANLTSAQGEVSRLNEVVGLYDQLESVGLDSTVTAGMGPLGLLLLAVQGGRALLETGAQEATQLLANVEVQSPAVANGLLWLENQINALASLLQNLEDALSQAVEPAAPVANQIGNFIGQILSLLPFGVGDHIRRGLETMSVILTHIPELVVSMNAMIFTPLRQWVSPDENKGLVAEVVRPINTNLVAPAQEVAGSVSALEVAYNDQLKTPTEQALAARAEIRNAIAALRGSMEVG